MGFGEVVQAINTACGVVSQEEHDTGAIFRPPYEGEVIGGEVEHWSGEGAGRFRPQSAAPLRGYPADSSGRDITPARRLLEASRCLVGWRIRVLVGLTQTVSTNDEDLGLFD
jgi:hypothetical protein